MLKLQSSFNSYLKSFTSPFTVAHVAILANPSLICFATSNTVFPSSTSSTFPSFSVTLIKVDTVWRSPIEFQISGVTIFDSVDVKFVDERGRYKFLEATFKSEKFAKDPVVLYGFRDQIAEPQKVNLDCLSCRT